MCFPYAGYWMETEWFSMFVYSKWIAFFTIDPCLEACYNFSNFSCTKTFTENMFFSLPCPVGHFLSYLTQMIEIVPSNCHIVRRGFLWFPLFIQGPERKDTVLRPMGSKRMSTVYCQEKNYSRQQSSGRQVFEVC